MYVIFFFFAVRCKFSYSSNFLKGVSEDRASDKGFKSQFLYNLFIYSTLNQLYQFQ